MDAVQPSPPIRLRSSFYLTKQFIARGICHPLVGRLISIIYQDRIPSHGSVIYTANSAVTPAIKASLFWGIYESAEVRFVRKYLNTVLDVVELGSSLGVVTSQILKKLQSGRRLVCVEANPNLLDTLKANIEANRQGTSVNLVHGCIALSPSVRFALGSDNVSSCVAESELHEQSFEVPGLTLSGILENNEIAGEFALVCDIEGAELCFIDNDKGALDNCQQMIIELHDTQWKGRPYTVDDLIRRLKERHGFSLLTNHGPVCLFERVTEPN